MIDHFQDPPVPHFGRMVLFTVLAAAFLGYSYPNILTGDENASMLFAIGGTLMLFDVALVIMWISAMAVHIARAWHAANDPYMRRVTAVSKLQPFQIEALPRNDAFEMGVHMGREIIPHLMTPGGPIPLEWIGRDFLPDCGVTYLKPIRHYADGSQGRNYAQWFTDCLIGLGMVMPYNGGPNPAQWATPETRDECIRQLEPYMNIIGIGLDPFEHGDPGLEARDWDREAVS